MDPNLVWAIQVRSRNQKCNTVLQIMRVFMPVCIAEDDELSQYGPTLPSLWEEYRCCHIEEGDSVNVDVATPSAIVAVALTYLKS